MHDNIHNDVHNNVYKNVHNFVHKYVHGNVLDNVHDGARQLVDSQHLFLLYLQKEFSVACDFYVMDEKEPIHIRPQFVYLGIVAHANVHQCRTMCMRTNTGFTIYINHDHCHIVGHIALYIVVFNMHNDVHDNVQDNVHNNVHDNIHNNVYYYIHNNEHDDVHEGSQQLLESQH